MEDADISTVTLEGSAAVLILAIAYKVYRARCSSRSKCCGDHVEFQSQNSGVREESV